MAETESGKKKWPLHVQIIVAMLIGTVIGVLFNSGEVPIQDSVQLQIREEADGIVLSEVVQQDGESLNLYEVQFASDDAFAASFPELHALSDTERESVQVENARARFVYTLGAATVTWQRTHNGVPAVTTITAPSADGLPAYWQDLAAENSDGTTAAVTTVSKSIGDLFLRLLKMVTVPLILTSLITGVTGLGRQGRFGRMFRRTILYYLSTSLLAIATGLLLVNLIRPGVGAVLPGGGQALETTDQSLVEVIYEQLLRLIPTNPFQVIADGEFLSIISFAILTGIFINVVGGDFGRRLREFFEAAFAVMMQMTAWVISLAPIGVAAFMLFATASQGLAIFQTLAWYMLTVFLALVLHSTVILPIIVKFIGKRSPLQFAQQMSPALLTAFSTASSNATLPLTLSCVEQRAGVSNQTSSFVLPLGATINMDGTALYEVVAVLFIAQATPGFDLSFPQQITVALTALIASVGAAGIPHAGLVMMAIVLQAVGLPLEAQGIIIAVDRILDMCRTAVNVWSDSCGCAIVDQRTETASATA